MGPPQVVARDGTSTTPPPPLPFGATFPLPHLCYIPPLGTLIEETIFANSSTDGEKMLPEGGNILH
ncbi:hypothetical protein E2C01_099917 [Portunus trituberculatus]|uniref:Uncharacterized protein n=1 Tax=Portunus trituberculatus TaxID=210409 RepID=A0A5B7KAQ7_PORTR|nr:hypothetical protein [Portunus trituberculatus]